MSRILAIMGSGETAPTMIKAHRAIFAAAGPPPVRAVLLDTPFGFQENADDLTAKTLAYFRESVDQDLGVATFRRADAATPADLERVRRAVREATVVFAGPGSPSYALAQWAGSPIPEELVGKLSNGGCVLFSSAAALTLGVATVPVYEIYKVGEDPRWLRGLDLLAAAGVRAAVIPHFDNAEGGTHDTRFCYLGERRLRMLEQQLDEGVFVLGIDEHTAAVFDLDSGDVEVLGRGVVTVRANGRSETVEAGTTVPVGRLADMASGRAHASANATGSAPDVTSSPPHPAVTDTFQGFESAFDDAMAAGDAGAALDAVLAAEAELWAWRTDPTQTDDLDRGRALLRQLIFRLGGAADRGLVDPATVIGPFVEAILDQRRSARTDGRWADADTARQRLDALGVEVRDGPDGTTWTLRDQAEGSGSRPA